MVHGEGNLIAVVIGTVCVDIGYLLVYGEAIVITAFVEQTLYTIRRGGLFAVGVAVINPKKQTDAIGMGVYSLFDAVKVDFSQKFITVVRSVEPVST